MLPQLQNRKEKSGILVTTSIAGANPFPDIITYGASKAFSCYLA
jgi:NADP-dependent 3-hydroxy acid dehydrogenase YdfG